MAKSGTVCMPITNHHVTYLLGWIKGYAGAIIAMLSFFDDPFIGYQVTQAVIDVMGLLKLNICAQALTPFYHPVCGIINIGFLQPVSVVPVTVISDFDQIAAPIEIIIVIITLTVHLFADLLVQIIVPILIYSDVFINAYSKFARLFASA
jgi:hypothetical protein